MLDGDGENTVPDGAGTLCSVYPVPDGGTPFNHASVRIDYDYTPAWMFGGGFHHRDAGVNVDAGSLQPLDAGKIRPKATDAGLRQNL